jgi:hypothetical protein
VTSERGHGSGARWFPSADVHLDGQLAGMGSSGDPELFDCVPTRRGEAGGDEETRTPDPLLAKEMLYQLSYVPFAPGVMVGASGLEPETSALSGQCSNQLS